MKEKLYPIEVVEREGERVKIHYIGCGADEGEWREASELGTFSMYIPLLTIHHRYITYCCCS